VPYYEMGMAARDCLIEAVRNNEATVQRILLDAKLVDGETLRSREKQIQQGTAPVI